MPGAVWNRADFKGKNQPATGVHDTDIDVFCKWLSEKEGRTYRIPTIYEFEYASRAGTDTLFWWGDCPDDRRMNYIMLDIDHD